MAQISLTFPDGNARNFDAGVTPAEVAASISNSLGQERRFPPPSTVRITICNGRSTHDAAIAIHTMADDAPALELIRHDLAHVMARAVQELWPDVKVTIGPVIENGWYYDFDRAEPFTPEDLGEIEKKMKEIINKRDPVHDRGLGPRARHRVLQGGQRTLQGRADRRPFPAMSRCACTGTATGRISAVVRICNTPGSCPPMRSS